MVFMQHGLALAMFMTAATLMAVWMWWVGALRPADSSNPDDRSMMERSPLLLGPTIVLLKSIGAFALGLVGGAVLWLSRATGSRFWLLLLAAIPILYVGVRSTGAWSGMDLVEAVSEYVEEDRARSLEFRFNNENVLIVKALEHSAFGWGGWGRSRIYEDDTGKDSAVTDGLWIIQLGDRGFFGLCGFGAALLMPVLRFSSVFPTSLWSARAVAPLTVCAVVVTLWCIDSLLNAMVLPLYILLAGVLAGIDPARILEPHEIPRA
jgi:hypothetical protein